MCINTSNKNNQKIGRSPKETAELIRSGIGKKFRLIKGSVKNLD